ncbi:MAG: hypothetical protein HY727_22055 [Candidatus Rokubacteria bacterium]|nr:hypothetical protein [Candidatus Rokubacteria bacterium]
MSRTARGPLVGWLAQQRWFASKTRRIEALTIEDGVPLARATIQIARVTLDDGTVDRYAIPLGEGSPIADALDDPPFCLALLDLIRRGGTAAGKQGEVRGRPTRAFPRRLPSDLPVRRLAGEQSNTSVVFGDALILKHYRRLAAGVHPEQEITRFLTERTLFRNAPRLGGHLEYRRHAGGATTLALVQELVVGGRDGWEWLLEELRGFHQTAERDGSPPDPERVRGLGGSSLRALRRLGEVTGALHLALASDASDAAFAPEPITAADLAGWADDVRRQVEAAQGMLGDRGLHAAPDPSDGLAGLAGRRKIRHHGDYHLGQTLVREAGADFVIIDFEGEPLRPLEARRRKHAAVRDVAGMLRSIDYAASAAREGVGSGGLAWADAWEAEARDQFLGGYRTATAGAPFSPDSDAAFRGAAAVFELEKAAYEIVYEANHRPQWLGIAARGFAKAAAALGRRSRAGAE